MSDQEYKSWMSDFASWFGMTSDHDLATILRWKPLVSQFRAEWVSEATKSLLESNETLWKGRLLNGLLVRLKRIRARAESIDKDVAFGESYQCELCGGSGRVIVPHLRCVSGKQWKGLALTRSGTEVHYRMAVACRCNLGQYFATSSEIMTISQYEEHNPYWDIQIAERNAELQLIASLSRDYSQSPTAFDLIIDRIQRRIHAE